SAESSGSGTWLPSAENTAAVFGVNQTPPSIRAMEGSEFTIECTFNSSNNSIKWFVEWNKTRNYVTEKLSNGTDRIRLSGDKEKRSPSLTVKKADVTDSGTYVCWVGNKDGTSRGNGTQEFFLMSNLKLPCCSLSPLLPVLSLEAKVNKFSPSSL
uniref:Ig-like domain-containing protein n=1 Tax=Chrysemys picta bellii TaxID=8478 RepID=A0A8C3FJF6_CHRPI